ncbi:phosphatidylinositol 4,5-bisphosphate 5-phosphatase A [Drosophila sechellia]|uniref:phosphatidylinositol 4,5-bisphosphate 5-phosphatase A n=1 Tax=Drosophila sechellia TaxID=7238 RepID=UPI0013DE267C|nr:phosphatidylinositol 4,5-bisphosphate 5-phosphatase A [Drosophila sechellia]
MERLQPGDECLECQSEGRNHKLRYFYIGLEEQLLKCESRSCLWPHNDEVSSDEDLDSEAALSITALQSELLESPAATQPSHPTASTSKPPPDDDDEFILELLQQLTPATETPLKTNVSPSSMPDLHSPSEEKPCPQLELPDFSFLEENIAVNEKPPQALKSELGVPSTVLPDKLRSPPKAKTLQTQDTKAKQYLAPLKGATSPSWQGKAEIPLLPACVKASVRMSPSIKSKGSPFSSLPKKASTQPQSQSPPSTPPAVNIIISVPEMNTGMNGMFLDAIKRHSTEAKPSLRGGGRRPKRSARGTNARGIRTQDVMHLIEHLELTTPRTQ